MYDNPVPYCYAFSQSYMRVNNALLPNDGIVTNENKREVDKVIHKIVGVKYKNCSATWKEVKKRLAEDEDGFITALKQALN
jgi:hypothetical protein